MASPYSHFPSYTHWRKSISEIPADEVDPVVEFPFRLSKNDLVATAGSCFAQHIARHLKNSGFSYYVAEQVHPIIGDSIGQQYNYGVFSCRYGNIYTSRQLVQLFERAYGKFSPQEDVWHLADGHAVDPFRPAIEPGGFADEDEMRSDREQHLARVKAMFEQLDCFVFTLGLTECWTSTKDGAVFPICPGVAGGEFNDQLHVFKNLDLVEILEDMGAFVRGLKGVNPGARIILTVSPVPLMATAENRHVLLSTTVSKSVLRIACEYLAKEFDDVAYFPSYEIITGNFSRGKYFADDLRSVTELGVGHVMRLFLKHATNSHDVPVSSAHVQKTDILADVQNLVEVICEEELYNG